MMSHEANTPPSAQPAALDAHDALLASHVHPPHWVNPTPPPGGRYNLVVIGAGTAGLVTAAGAAGLGAKVALIERHRMGGDCLNVGCVPSKSLLRSARHRESRPPSTDFSATIERVHRLRATLAPHDSAQRFKSLGVDVYFGEARFASADTVEVAGQTLHFARACIATGSRPAVPPIEGLDRINYLTNETVFDLTDLPPRLAVIGAGPIGCELAQAFARLGSQVHLIEAAHGVLPKDDPEAGQIVLRSMQRDGVTLLCCGKELKVEPAATGGGGRLRVESHGEEYDITVDRVLVATGRLPNVERLNLEAAGVEYERRPRGSGDGGGGGVKVDDHLRTTNRRIFAAGDVCSAFQFTHIADAHARIVIRNALFGFLPFKPRVSRLVVPWCTYTFPQVAHVGRGPDEECETIRIDMGQVDRAVLDDETEGFLKVHIEKGGDKIIGATLVAAHAGEIISQITTAMVHGKGLGGLSRVIYPYPTQAECIRKGADAHQRSRLTPRLKRLTTKVLGWQR